MTTPAAATPLHQLFDLARQHRTAGVTLPRAVYRDARAQLVALRDIAESGVWPASRVAERARICLKETDVPALSRDNCTRLTMESQHVLREASLMLDVEKGAV